MMFHNRKGYDPSTGKSTMHTQSLLKLTTLMIVLLLLAIPTAFAQDVVSNLPTDNVYEGWCSPVAVGFEVPDGNNYRLTNLRAAMRHINTDNMTFTLHRDSNGTPGAMMTIVDTLTVTKDGIYNFVPGASVVLEGGQTYWIYADASACNATWDDLGASRPTGEFSIVGYVRQTDDWVDASLNGRLTPKFVLEAEALDGETPVLSTETTETGA